MSGAEQRMGMKAIFNAVFSRFELLVESLLVKIIASF